MHAHPPVQEKRSEQDGGIPKDVLDYLTFLRVCYPVTVQKLCSSPDRTFSGKRQKKKGTCNVHKCDELLKYRDDLPSPELIETEPRCWRDAT